MKLFLAVCFLACACSADKLDKTYLPPSSAQTAGGDANSLVAPFSGHPSTEYNVGRFNAGNQHQQHHQTQHKPTVPVLSYNNDNAGDGTYNFAFQTANGISQQEQGNKNHNNKEVVMGSYSFTAPDGQTFTVMYEADENGFRPVGDHIPKQPTAVTKPNEQTYNGHVSSGQYQTASAQGNYNQGVSSYDEAAHVGLVQHHTGEFGQGTPGDLLGDYRAPAAHLQPHTASSGQTSVYQGSVPTRFSGVNDHAQTGHYQTQHDVSSGHYQQGVGSGHHQQGVGSGHYQQGVSSGHYQQGHQQGVGSGTYQHGSGHQQQGHYQQDVGSGHQQQGAGHQGVSSGHYQQGSGHYQQQNLADRFGASSGVSAPQGSTHYQQDSGSSHYQQGSGHHQGSGHQQGSGHYQQGSGHYQQGAGHHQQGSGHYQQGSGHYQQGAGQDSSQYHHGAVNRFSGVGAHEQTQQHAGVSSGHYQQDVSAGHQTGHHQQGHHSQGTGAGYQQQHVTSGQEYYHGVVQSPTLDYTTSQQQPQYQQNTQGVQPLADRFGSSSSSGQYDSDQNTALQVGSHTSGYGSHGTSNQYLPPSY